MSTHQKRELLEKASCFCYYSPVMAKKRKTRQEKKIAELRRKLSVQKRATSEVSRPKSAYQDLSKKTKLPPQTPSLRKDLPFQTLDKKTVKDDLLKALILSALAISLELVVYFIFKQA